MPAKTLMVQGTMSSAGKSLLVTGLCRIFARRGLRVAPYKSQNMSNNAAVCLDGSEIGRAQYTQAQACHIEPTVEMNPILIKPEADTRSQIVVMGQPYASLAARDYYKHIDQFWQTATDALDKLRAENDLVIIEGAGSPVELNLKRGDIVNMAIAKYAQSPVLLAGDIDRGGIFAQLLGTLWLLDPEERALVKGLLINKFRGDISLFYDGVKIIEEKGGAPVVGVIPYIHHQIPEEDAVAIEAQNSGAAKADGIDIVVIRLPRISNFDDFLPLHNEPGVNVRYIDYPNELGAPDAVILPGTKSTIADLTWLTNQGLDVAIQQYAEQGGTVVGICGGYQMLGKTIRDPNLVEAAVEQVAALGLLETETIFQTQKNTYQAEVRIQAQADWLADIQGDLIQGYEIHMGETKLLNGNPWLEIVARGREKVSVGDGAISPNGNIWGCYIHGLFENHNLRHAWLTSLGWQASAGSKAISLNETLDDFADQVEAALNIELLEQIIGL